MDFTRTDLYDYVLPEALIAQEPPENRGESRMLVLNRATGQCEITTIDAIADYLRPGDCMVFNDTKVMKARLFGRKNGTDEGARTEIFLLAVNPSQPTRWQCLLKPGKRLPPGSRIRLIDRANQFTEDWATVIERHDDGSGTIEFSSPDVPAIQERCGHIPLPPYIRRNDNDNDGERYQTVFARQSGAVAAPTAGLHFTPEILARIGNKGIQQVSVTLHVGLGTFRPVETDDLREHRMHREEFIITGEAAAGINAAHAAGGRVLAIGTTSVRVLESCADENGKLQPQLHHTEIFIYPPYRFKATDMLLTNFHLPKSTLLMLVSAFAGRELILEAYRQAIAAKMRFFSYGDCMLII